MKKENKSVVVSEIKEALAKSTAGVVTTYQGLPTAEIVNLRHKLREAGLDLQVVKNTLMRRAAKEAGRDFMEAHFEGANAVVLGYDDVSAPARVLMQFITSSGVGMTVSGGFLANRWLDAGEVNTLATLPTKNELIARLLGGFQSPITGLVQALSSPMLGIVYALNARIQQMEEK
ncbi:MAG: 50S ribosomal protein L10 [Dehalococcoidia bacterium]|nr:50S ribosomal protein L10 [Dehalococcoidia bacterium]